MAGGDNGNGADGARSETRKRSLNFIEEIVAADVQAGKNDRRVHTRFPPEPNGFLHIGHAKAICLNHGLAEKYDGKFNLRFDDTNPIKEEDAFVTAIKHDIRWLGCDWEDRLFFASDYFETMYDHAVTLIKRGRAYVDDLPADQIRAYRGTLTEPGRDSPFRDRPAAESLELFERMKNGEFPDGSRVLRAKIDMASPNLNLRDPVMYRILHAAHHRTGDKWCVYPMYDWAHGLEDSIEGITHSLCSLEFENHRPLYDWFLQQLGVYQPRQIEFARLALTNTVMSKRTLRMMVEEGHVNGWDDPRMPTLSALRRRGFTSESIFGFCDRIGVAKFNSTIDVGQLEFAIREDLNRRAPRVMGVLNPLKVVIENYPQGESETLEAINNPEDPSAGVRRVPFSRELYIEREDFMEDAPRKFFRLAPGREVRLRYAFFVTCVGVIKNDAGEVVELRCTYDPATRGGDAPDGRKVKGTLHWVSAAHALTVEARLYDRLFTVENPAKSDMPIAELINPESLNVIKDARLEPNWDAASVDWPDGIKRVQFERLGYFCVDPDSTTDKLVFNRTVTLKDTWAKVQKKGG